MSRTVFSFAARYSGRCAGCPEMIRPGDRIVMEDQRPYHVDCTRQDVPDVEGKREPDVCPRCHLAHAGECF